MKGVEAASGSGSRWQVAGRALRHRNFQLFFSGQLISLIGTWMQSVAQSWLVYRLTGSALLLGSVGFASQVPVFLFAPLGRDHCRSLEPPTHRNRDASGGDAAGLRSGGAHAVA